MTTAANLIDRYDWRYGTGDWAGCMVLKANGPWCAFTDVESLCATYEAEILTLRNEISNLKQIVNNAIALMG